jgi:hypothetical protein
MILDASDNCGLQSVSQSVDVGTTVYNGQTVNVVGIAVDLSGNTVNCTTSYTVQDMTPPSLIFGCADQQTENANSQCNNLVPDFTIIAADDCDDNLIRSQDPVQNTPVGSGNHTITVTLTDHSGTYFLSRLYGNPMHLTVDHSHSLDYIDLQCNLATYMLYHKLIFSRQFSQLHNLFHSI